MKRYQWIIPIIIIVFSAFTAYQWGVFPAVQKTDSSKFSAMRVAEDLKIISQHPHSIIHTEERIAVRDYLVHRLQEQGSTPILYTYPNIKSRKYIFDACNIFAEFPPLMPSKDTTYLLLVAHYDSCYPRIMRGDTVTSYGAADDGYGLGVILDCVQLALKERANWHQGIRILFTDAEEVDLVGMQQAFSNNKEIFKNVGLVINLEARGTYGPVMLFETSPQNEKLIKLYQNHAKNPYTYSLTNLVYRSMPNGTDFTVIKDSLHGFNFSTIADIKHYHTDLDNIKNISLSSIQHYGAQIAPIILHYLTDKNYADKNFLNGEQDAIYFTIPLIGFIHFSQTGYLIINIILFILFIIWLHFEHFTRRIKWSSLFKQIGQIFLLSTLAFGSGVLIVWYISQSIGMKFSFLRVIGAVAYDHHIMIITIIVWALIILWIGIKKRGKTHFLLPQFIYGILSLQLLFSALLLFSVGENMPFFLPFATTFIGVLMWRICSSKLFLGLALCVISLHAFSFLYILAMALTIGTFGIIMFIAFYDLLGIIMLSLLFCNGNTKQIDY